MEKTSKDLMIIRQSTLKVLPELCKLVDFKPEGLRELLRLGDIITDWVVAGNYEPVDTEVKRFDRYLERNHKLDEIAKKK